MKWEHLRQYLAAHYKLGYTTGVGSIYAVVDGAQYACSQAYTQSTWRAKATPNFIATSDPASFSPQSVYYRAGLPWNNLLLNQNWIDATLTSTIRAGHWMTDCVGMVNASLVIRDDIDAWANGTYQLKSEYGSGWKINSIIMDNATRNVYGNQFTANCQGWCRQLDRMGLLHTMDDFDPSQSGQIVFCGGSARIYNWDERLSDEIGHTGFHIGNDAVVMGIPNFLGEDNMLESTSNANDPTRYIMAHIPESLKTYYSRRYGVNIGGCSGVNSTSDRYVNQVCRDGVTRSVKERISCNGGRWSYWAWLPHIDYTPTEIDYIIAKRRRHAYNIRCYDI